MLAVAGADAADAAIFMYVLEPLSGPVQDTLAAGGVVGGGKPVQGVSDGTAAGGSGGAAGLVTKAASAVHAAEANASGSFQISALVRASPAVHALPCCVLAGG